MGGAPAHLLLLLSACTSGTVDSPHRDYAEGLVEAGLAAAPAGQAWLEAADSVLASPRTILLPFSEEGWLPADRASAIGLRFDAPAQRWVTIRMSLDEPDFARVFIDAFRMPREPGDSIEVIASAPDTMNELTLRVRRSADLVVRVQPELLRGGPYRLTVMAAEEEPVTHVLQRDAPLAATVR